MSQPDNGRPIQNKTIVKVIYDNDAIYVAALLYDDEPIKLEEISQRDSFGIRRFGVFINGFNDGQRFPVFCQRC
jgi:hypothetical protein